MEQTSLSTDKHRAPYVKLIIAVSIVVPILVAVLFKVQISGYDFTFLPPVYASINGVTAILLVAALISIRNGNKRVHEFLMKTCMILSATFLAMYVLYHMTTPSTSFGGTGMLRNIYFFILISHILLSVGVIPLVLFYISASLAKRV